MAQSVRQIIKNKKNVIKVEHLDACVTFLLEISMLFFANNKCNIIPTDNRMSEKYIKVAQIYSRMTKRF